MILTSSLCHALGIFCRFVYFLSFGFKALLVVVVTVVALVVVVVVVVFCCCCRRVTTARKHFAGFSCCYFCCERKKESKRVGVVARDGEVDGEGEGEGGGREGGGREGLLFHFHGHWPTCPRLTFGRLVAFAIFIAF